MTKMYFDNDFVEERIIEFQKTKDPKIIDELTPIFKKLILGVIGRYKLLRRNYVNDDLSQEAWVGILEAAPKWSKEKGDAFSYFTGVARNKIFWYLKSYYQDTSIDSDDLSTIALDDENSTFELSDEDSAGFENESAIKDYVLKLTPEILDLPDDLGYAAILDSIKRKIVHGDSVKYEDLIKETQKEIGHPKKKVRFVLDQIYSHFMGE
jgi:DNA-directed RNA polymerase specialized sigma24 family protein